jgi:hypothetical protein
MKDGWIGTSLPPLSRPFQNEMAPMKGDDGKPMGWTMVGSSPKEERRSRSIVKGGGAGYWKGWVIVARRTVSSITIGTNL